MSFNSPNLIDVVKKQYVYKLWAYASSFSTLVAIQIIAVFFSFLGSGMSGSGNFVYEITIKYYSADMFMIFTMIWGLITAFIIVSKPFLNPDFYFVTNRISSFLSNLLFMMTASIIGAITTILSSFLLKVMVYFQYDSKQILVQSSDYVTPSEFFMGFSASFMYILLGFSIGYFFGLLKEISKLLLTFVATLLLGGLFTGLFSEMNVSIYQFFSESSYPLFMSKILFIVTIVFLASFFISRNMEVKW